MPDKLPDQHPTPDLTHLAEPSLDEQPIGQTAQQASVLQPRPSDMPLPVSTREAEIRRPNKYVPTSQAITEHVQRQNELSGTEPLDNGGRSLFDQREMVYKPGMLKSIQRNIVEDGLFSNTARWVEQQHASIIDPDPDEAAKITEAMPELMRGLAPSDQEYLDGLPTLELAEREAQRIRDQRYYQMLRADEGFLHSLVAGIGGFILDPLNLVPGAVIIKGARLAPKMGQIASRATAQAPTKGGIVANALKWSAFGGAEELIRAQVRYQADPLFQEREYREAVFMALGFGGAIPLIPSAFRGGKSLGKHGLLELERAQKRISQSEAGVGFAQSLRTARTFLSDVDTSSARAFRKMDKGQVWQDAKAKVFDQNRTAGRKLRGESIKESTSKARTAMDDSNYSDMTDGTLEVAVETLVDAGTIGKDLAEHFLQSIKESVKSNVRLAKIVAKAAKTKTGQRVVKKAGEKVKEKVREGPPAARAKAVAKSKEAVQKGREAATGAAESLGRLTKSTTDEGRAAFSKLEAKVNSLRTKIDDAETRINKAQDDIDVQRTTKDAEAIPETTATREDAVAHFEAIASRINRLKDLLNKESEPSPMPKNPTADDIQTPGNLHKPDRRGEIADAVDDLERIIDYDGPGFGADTAGAARVNDIRTKKEKAIDALKDISDDSVREARAQIEVLRATRDEILAQLPPATSEEMIKSIKFLYGRKINALSAVSEHRAKMRGIRPAHRELTDTAGQVMDTFRVFMPEAHKGFKTSEAALIARFPELKDLKMSSKLSSRLNDSLRQALLRVDTPNTGIFRDTNLFTDAGLEKGIRIAFEELGNSPTQRIKLTEGMSKNWEKQYSALREDLSLERISSDTIDNVFDYLDHNAGFVAGKLDFIDAQIKSPLEDLLRVDPIFQEMSDQFEASGWGPLLEDQFVNNKLNQALANQAGGLTHSLASQFLGSGVPLQQNLSLRLFETSAGFGGEKVAPTNTAAIVADNLHQAVLGDYQRAYAGFKREWAKEQEWSRAQSIANYKGHSHGYSDIAKMHEAVMIEQNARRLGKESTTDSAAVAKFLDAADEGYAALHDMQMQSGITGVNENNRIKHHQKQTWNDEKFLQLASTPEGKTGVIKLYSQGLTNAGHTEANAYALATGFFDSKHAQLSAPRLGMSQRLDSQTIKGAMPDIETVLARVKKNGASDTQLKDIANIINDKSSEISGPGYLNHQMKIDYSAETMINGKNVRVVDLLDLDMPGHFERQSKESTALVAINDAFDGQLNSYSAIDDYIQSMANQAQSMGGKNMALDARNAIGMMTGRDYDGQLPKNMRLVRGHLNLTGMGGLMESQLAEMGLALTRGSASITALKQVKDARKGDLLLKHGADPDALHWAVQQNKGLLDELHALTGNSPDLASLSLNNVIFNETEFAPHRQPNVAERILDTATGGKYRPALQSLQTNLTGYGKVRAFEDDVANMSVLNDLARRFIDPKTRDLLPDGVPGRSTTSDARWADMGIDTTEAGFISKLFDPINGFIQIDEGTGNIRSLNIDEWSVADRRQMGVILGRNSSRQIQKAYVGETSPVLMNPWWAFAAQFRSYTMIAAEKQQVRNMKFGDKEFATGLMLNAASSAFSRVVRIHSLAMALPVEDRQDFIDYKMQNIGYETMKYMAAAATLPELTGMINQVVGQPFGAHPAGAVRGGEDLIPALGYFSRLTQISGLPSNDAEMGRMQNMLQLGTISQSNLLFGVMRNALYGDSDNESE